MTTFTLDTRDKIIIGLMFCLLIAGQAVIHMAAKRNEDAARRQLELIQDKTAQIDAAVDLLAQKDSLIAMQSVRIEQAIAANRATAARMDATVRAMTKSFRASLDSSQTAAFDSLEQAHAMQLASRDSVISQQQQQIELLGLRIVQRDSTIAQMQRINEDIRLQVAQLQEKPSALKVVSDSWPYMAVAAAAGFYFGAKAN